jgi:hypothetical protein
LGAGPLVTDLLGAHVRAITCTSNVLPIIAEIRKSGATTFRAITDALNVRGVPTRAAGVGTR